MVETRSQRSRRESEEALRSLNMSTYEFDGDEFYNPFDNRSNIPDHDNDNNENNNGNDKDNDNASVDFAEVEETIMDPHFNKLVQEIMKRDRQYFLQVMVQSGTRLPHNFDMS